MNSPSGTRLNAAPIVTVAFSVFCWICLYAAFADFAQAGSEMIAGSGVLRAVAGAVLVALHALGLLLLVVLGAGAVVMIREAADARINDRRLNGNAH